MMMMMGDDPLAGQPESATPQSSTDAAKVRLLPPFFLFLFLFCKFQLVSSHLLKELDWWFCCRWPSRAHGSRMAKGKENGAGGRSSCCRLPPWALNRPGTVAHGLENIRKWKWTDGELDSGIRSRSLICWTLEPLQGTLAWLVTYSRWGIFRFVLRIVPNFPALEPADWMLNRVVNEILKWVDHQWQCPLFWGPSPKWQLLDCN